MRKTKSLKEYISFIILAIITLYVFFSSLFLTYNFYDLQDYSKYLVYIGIVLLITYILSKIKNLKFNKFEIIIFILIILGLISSIFAINTKDAFFGNINRGEGFFVICTYYLIFLNAMNIKNINLKKVLIGFILAIGSFNIIYGLFQTDIISASIFSIKEKWYFAKGLNGNSMYYASLLSICYPITIGLFIKETKLFKSIIYFLLMTFFSFGILNSGSMGAFVGCILLFIFIIVYAIYSFIKEKEKKRVIIITSIKIVLVILVYFISYIVLINTNHNFNEDVNQFYNESSYLLEKKKTDSSFGTGRIYIWKNALPVIKENPLFGVGIDNFRNAFDPPLIDKQSALIVDKAHNEYLQKITCEGLISGIIYIIFLLLIFINGLNSKDKITYILLLGMICYSIQAFFNISVTRVSPLFFLVLGLIIENKKCKRTNKV